MRALRAAGLALAVVALTVALPARPALATASTPMARTSSAEPPPVSPAAARRDARQVLERDRYQPRQVPRPFRGLLRWIGDRLDPVIGPVGRFLAAVVANPAGAIAVGLLVAVLAALGARLVIGRRTRVAVERQRGTGPPALPDPAELLRRAEVAEAAGRLEEALRLRFRAGLLGLDRAGVLTYRPEATSGELVGDLRSETFSRLAATFDEVVYGERAAAPGDLESARAAWPRVLDEAGRR